MSAEPPFAVRLPRQPGTKESRYAHLLAGEVQIEEREAVPRLEAATLEVRQENERILRVEDELALVKGELAELRQQFVEFKKQFE